MKTYQSFWKRLSVLLVAALLTVSFTACSSVGTLVPGDSEGKYVNEKTGKVYLIAPDCYTVTSYRSDEAVALNDGVSFYAVDGTENDSWLYSPDFGILLYAEGETLPTLSELAPTMMDVRLEDDGIMKTAFEVGSADKISAVLGAYESGNELRYMGERANYTFYLEFTSEGYPWLVYNLVFMQFAEEYLTYGKDENGEDTVIENGKNFLYNRTEDRFVAIGDELQEYIDGYYHNADAE